MIDGAEGSAVVMSVEDLSEVQAARLNVIAGNAHLVLPPARLRRLGLERQQPGIVALPTLDLDRIENLALKVDGRIDAPVCVAGPLDEQALELARLSLVLPAVIVVPLADGVEVDRSVLRVSGAAIGSYRRAKVRDLKIVEPRARAARRRAHERIRGVSRRRGPARSSGNRRRQARISPSRSPFGCIPPA